MTTVQIRNGVFETNSSSSHSLTIAQGDLVFDPAIFSDPSTARQGVVYVSLDEYGWEFEDYYTFEDKLSYVLTDLLAPGILNWESQMTQEQAQENEYFRKLDDILFERMGVRIELRPSYGYVDHQSAGFAKPMIDDVKQLEQFLFHPGSMFSTGNDNE